MYVDIMLAPRQTGGRAAAGPRRGLRAAGTNRFERCFLACVAVHDVCAGI